MREGYFKDVDAIIYLHIGDQLSTGFGLQNYAAISSLFTFHGQDRARIDQSVGRAGTPSTRSC